MRYRLKEIRESKGLTQQELADKAGCSRQFVNMIENSDSLNVSSKKLLDIANALDVKIDDLIFFEQNV